MTGTRAAHCHETSNPPPTSTSFIPAPAAAATTTPRRKGRVTWMWRVTSRLGKSVVPGRLTDVVPEWLVAATRLRRAPVPWAEMIRAGIAICVPLSAGIAAGQRALGLLTAMGGLLGVVVDTGGPFAARLR